MKQRKYEIQCYTYRPGYKHQKIKAIENELFLVHTTENSSGFSVRRLSSWREGAEELVHVCDKEDEARNVMTACIEH